MPRYTTAEHERALAQLREWLKPGDTVFTIVRHVSRSGMSRSISLFATVNGQPCDITYQASRVIGESVDQKHGGIRMGGCGMDMGFAAVYALSRAMFPDGFGCIGEDRDAPRNSCPASDHNNGDRSYCLHLAGRPLSFDERTREPLTWERQSRLAHWHSSGGYALRQRWM